jgi:hypothetical protein
VIDVADPESLRIATGVGTGGPAWGVAVSGTHAYVAADWAGLQVIDITDPGNPQIVGSADTPAYAYDVAASGTHAYVADYDAGLQVIDIADPASPEIVSSVGTPGYAWGVTVSGAHAYVAGVSGVLVIDVTDPQNPRAVGSMDTPDNALGVAVSGPLAYVADGYSGLQIVPAQCGGPSSFDQDVKASPAARVSALPNPMSHRAAIRFELPTRDEVSATVHEVDGRRVRSLCHEILAAGVHALPWDGLDDQGRPVAAGTYVIRVRTAGGTRTGKFVVVR